MTVLFKAYRPTLVGSPAATHAPGAPVADERPFLNRLRAGDREAFEELFRTYYEPLCGFVLSYVRSLDVAEEQVQEVFWWIWEQRARVEAPWGLRTYLYVAARHRALNWLKHEAVAERWERRAAQELGLAGVGQGPPAAELVLHQREISVALSRAIARLPDRRRQAFELVWQHGLPQAEAAAVMGISVKGVEAALTKAIASLRGSLAAVDR